MPVIVLNWLIVVASLTLFLSANEYSRHQSTDPSYTLGVEFGLRNDALSWSKGKARVLIRNNVYSPDILSELTWDRLRTYYSKIRLEGDHDRYHLSVLYGVGTAHSGNNQDSDYLYSGRQGEFSRSDNKSDGSVLQDWSVALGYKYRLFEFLEGILLLGYAHNTQKLIINDGYQTISMFHVTGPIHGLESWYKSQWSGWWIGVDLDMRLAQSWNLSGGYAHHFIDYHARANWNLRTELAQESFRHEATGQGVRMYCDVEYVLSHHWSVSMAYAYLFFSTDLGVETIHFSNGTKGQAALNEVEWKSHASSLGVRYRF
jgi:opacity protein-like surface antigen